MRTERSPQRFGRSSFAWLTTYPRCRRLEQNFAAEAVKLCGPSPDPHRDLARRPGRSRTLDESAEGLLGRMRTKNGFHRSLQLKQRELVRHQLEDHRAVFDLGARAADGGRKNAPMIEPHRRTKPRTIAPQ